MKRSAILYDFIQVQGGAEAVTLDLYHRFHELDLIVAFVNFKAFPELLLEPNLPNTLTSPTQILGWQTVKSCLAFEQKTSFLKKYRNLVFSGSNSPLAIVNSEADKNIYYCHTPPRFVYDLKEHYLSKAATWQKPLLTALIRFLQPRFEVSIAKMDKVYANSRNVQGRLKEYLKVDSEVLYPPCKTDRFRWIGQGDYFLSTARVEEYKRVEHIVRAFMQLPDRKLIVTSGGSQLEELKRLAAGAKNISFTGWVSETKLAELVGNCLATIYIPIDEDFGMSPVESMGAGKPVIGVDEGGVRETIIHNVTGWLLPENPLVEDIIELVESISPIKLNSFRGDCEKQASFFCGKEFYSVMESYI